MDKAVREIRLKHWEALIREAVASGMHKKEWCREHGIHTRQFYYWQKKVREYALEKMGNSSIDGPVIPMMPIPGTQATFLELNPRSAGTPAAIDKLDAYAGDSFPYNPGLIVEVNRCRVLISDHTREETLRKVMRVILDA